MKKLGLLVLTLVTFVFAGQKCFSQHPIFISGGIHDTWIHGDDPTWKGGLLRGYVGAGMPILNLSDRISLIGELDLSLEGSGWTETASELTATAVSSGHTGLLYLNLPIVLRYLDKAKFFGEIGLQPGYLLAAQDHYSGHTENYTGYVKSFDLGLPIGVGYQLLDNLEVSIRYTIGLLNMEKVGTDKDHNYVLGVRVNYYLTKGKK